jgi:isoaspartyl peptidase/L-asparaginase-like protein (Ntn-hydrolase superfamily)
MQLDGLMVKPILQQNGGTAVEAVEAAVCDLENNEYFNAGYGSLLNNDREVECDAMIMEGHTLKYDRITLVIYMLITIVRSPSYILQSLRFLLTRKYFIIVQVY